MKVTGWTYWDDDRYRDICNERVSLARQLIAPLEKIPTGIELANMSEEELQNKLKLRRQSMDAALDCEEIHKLDEIIRRCTDAVIGELKLHGYHFTGNAHQNATHGVPIIDDTYVLQVSQRSWGGLIAAAFPDEIDNSDGYGYLKWSWDVPVEFADKLKLPEVNI